jgi:hypothetical protein
MKLFIGAFTKFRKPTATFVMSLSVFLSLRPHEKTQLPLNEFSLTLMSERYSKFFSRKYKIYNNLTRMTVTSHDDLCKFMITPR